MLFMDALELDMAIDTSGDLADLKPHNLERDLRKAYVGFSSLSFRTIITGPWGCGAFGGDPAVKAIILWMAASLAGVPTLKILLDPSHREIGEKLPCLIQAARVETTGQLRVLLGHVPGSKRMVEILDWLIGQVGK
jgi:poly(ADP-ribose) glycohydrolase